MFFVGNVVAGVPIPFADSFEIYTQDMAIPPQNDAWDPSVPSGLVATASSDSYSVGPPFTSATHRTVAALDGVARVEFEGTEGLTQCYTLLMVKPVLGDTPESITLGMDREYALYFNTNGHIVVYRTDLDPVSGEYPTVWTELTHAPVSTTEWYHIQICIDYRTGALFDGSRWRCQKFFQVSLNGTNLTHHLAVKQPTFYSGASIPAGDRNGSWFHCADFQELIDTNFAPGRPQVFHMEGIGTIDDLFVNDNPTVPDVELTLASTHPGVAGVPAIPSTNVCGYGSNVVCSVNDPLVSIGSSTQFVCTGWTDGYGTVPASSTNTNVRIVVNENSGLTWRWGYRYYLDTKVSGNGLVDIGGGWYSEDGIVRLKATPAFGETFLGWSGDVPLAETNNNPLDLLMDQARTVTANFSVSPPQYTSHGTPHAWLSEYGVTNNFESADTNDWDLDESMTWEEYAAGTDPKDSNSVFGVRSITIAGNGFRVEWFGTTNHGVTNPFVVLRRTNVMDLGNWDTVGTDIGRAPDGTNSWSDNTPPAGGKAFYRIEIPWP
jgi:hypothetical protein